MSDVEKKMIELHEKRLDEHSEKLADHESRLVRIWERLSIVSVGIGMAIGIGLDAIKKALGL